MAQTHNYTEVPLTFEQREMMEIARTAFMQSCPFFAHYFYSEMREVPTLDIPTAATDGRHIFYNPEYLSTLKTQEQVFALAHEVDHVVCRDVERMDRYRKAGDVFGVPYDPRQYNVVCDYVRNALLIETNVGLCNPAWCYADDVTGDDIVEDVYKRKYVAPPPPPPPPPGGDKEGPEGKGRGGQPPPPGGGQPGKPGKGPTTYGDSGRAPKGAKPDKTAQANGGRFDDVLPPPVDPVTGKVDLPGEMEFKEAVSRAAAAAKAMGNMPAQYQKRVDELLQPRVNWREHLRMLVTGRIGARHETWQAPNRKRLVLNPMVITPGKRGYGADLVVVGLDTSGSIYCSPKALEAFFSEVSGILADVRPKSVILIECDAEVQRVCEANTLDELEYSRSEGVKGGGGTDFRPVFNYIEKEKLKPDTLLYFTDLQGAFPTTKPSFPVIWGTIMEGAAPFGEVVFVSEEGE